MYSSMLPVCERAIPSKDVMAAPRRRVRERKTAPHGELLADRDSKLVPLCASSALQESSAALASVILLLDAACKELGPRTLLLRHLSALQLIHHFV